MTCPSCGHENPARSNFCLECGAAFAVRCANCDAEVPASAKFCNRCGQPVGRAELLAPERDPRAYTPKHLADKILQSKSALEGERKQVTVLFADVKGSTELAAELDPEEWHGISDRFLQILADGIHRFEGKVNQFTGDGVMALFGAPIAHEDHAQRACYAALHLRDALKQYGDEVRRSHGITLAFRIGINSGEVVVGKIGDDLRMDYTAAGLTTNLADRVQRLADPGSVNVSEHTSRLVEGYFRLRNLGDFELPGASERVGIHELEGVGEVRTRLEGARRRGFSKFVGREDEMATLEAAVSRADQGQGQVVGVRGEAGVGKSRLCAVFVERCRTRGIPVYEAHCPPHGRAVSFLPILELLRAFFEIEERDSDHKARRKITGELMLLDGSFHQTLPLVFDFLGVGDTNRAAPDMSTPERQQQLFAFVRRLLQAHGARQPTVVFFDDIHWIDSGSDAFLAQMVEAVGEARVTLLVNFRPEYKASWTGRSYYHQLPLLPLGDKALRALLGDLLGSDPSVAELPELIRNRTGGNPFFVEEVVQSLVESGDLVGERSMYRLARSVKELDVPTSVTALLAARIDRLPDREKRVLQSAAVIGKVFSHGLIRHLAKLPDIDLSEALNALRDSDFLHELAIYPQAEYSFKHPLTHQVAYDSQLAKARARSHEAVARALENLHADRLDQEAANLAYHFDRAEREAEAAHWYGRAAEWTQATDLAGAMRYWRRVRKLMPVDRSSGDPAPLALRARIQIAELALWVGGERGESLLAVEECLELAAQVTDAAARLRLQAKYLFTKPTLSAPTDRDLELCEVALNQAEQLGDDAVFAEVARAVYDTRVFAGEFDGALSALERAIARYAASGSEPLVDLVRYRGVTLLFLGRLAEAREEIARALEWSRSFGDINELLNAENITVQADQFAGNFALMLSKGRPALERAEKADAPFYIAFLQLFLGEAHLRLGELDESRLALERGMAVVQETGALSFHEPFFKALLSEVHAATGDPASSLPLVEAAAAAEGKGVARMWVPTTCARALRLANGLTASAQIEELLQEAMDIVNYSGARWLHPEVLIERAELARLAGDDAAWQRGIREAHRLYTEMGAVGHAERVATELAEL